MTRAGLVAARLACVVAVVLVMQVTPGLVVPIEGGADRLIVEGCLDPPLPAGSRAGCPLWEFRFEGDADHTEHAGVLVTPEGRQAVAWGFDGGYFEGTHFVAAHDPVTGLPLWRVEPGITVRYVAVGNDQVLHVAGATPAVPSEQSAVLVTLNVLAGTESWRTVLPGPPGYPTSLAVGPDGISLYAAIFHPSIGEGGASTLFALDALDGTVRWSRSIDRVNVNALALHPDGSGVAAGNHCPTDSELSCLSPEHDLFVQAWDSGTGEPGWTTFYDGDHGEDTALRVWIPDAESILVAGRTTTANGGSILIARLHTTDGAFDWMDTSMQHDTFGPHSGAALSPDGTVLYLSTFGAWRAGAGVVAAVVAYVTQTGDRAWETSYAIAPPPGYDVPFTMVYDLALDPLNMRVYLTGIHLDGTHEYPCAQAVIWVCVTHPQPCRGTPDLFVAELDAAHGDLVWTTTYDLDGHADYAHTLAVDPEQSRLFVAGTSVLRYSGPYLDAIPPPNDDYTRCLTRTTAATVAAFGV